MNFYLYFCSINDLIRNNMNGDIFEDLMSNDGATGMVDPLSGDAYNPLEDFEQFQNQSPATRVVDEDEGGGYREVPFNLLDDEGGEKEKPADQPVDDSFIVELLKSKGINPDSIKVQDEESDEVKEVKFSELSTEEKRALLEYQTDEIDFTDHEIEAVEFLRENNMTLSDLAKAIREKTLAELQTSSTEPTYEVDDFSDDELFIIDFKNKYGEDYTDDELIEALERAKENEELYNRQMGKVRDNFKEYERLGKEQAEQEKIAAEQAREEEYISQVVQVARSLNDMHDTVDLDDDDKEGVLSYMFDKLPTGESGLERALKDPASRYKAAWYLKNGDDVFKEIHRYYKGEIDRLSKMIPATAKLKPEAFIKPTNNKQHTTQQRPRKLEDLYN